ncbi:hypothetical protein GVN18_27700 [Pseudomonas sp. ODNR1LW]|nr:hypothetical protein [Pseudomonas sp. ODNR1LW]
MLAALVLLLAPQAAPTVVWETSPPPAAEAPPPTAHNVPAWGVADPFGYERARCSPQLRGERSLEVCQAEVRAQLAAALGPDLPDALRPSGMAGECQMTQAEERGAAYGLQCGPQTRTAAESPLPKEVDCRPRPERGGFSSECRPVGAAEEKGLKLKLWGND